MLPDTPAVAHFAGATPAFSAEQDDLLRAADRLRTRLKRAPRLTELLQLFRAMGYRRLPADLVEAYDAGTLGAPPAPAGPAPAAEPSPSTVPETRAAA
jgi:hypothetical protein